MIINEEMKMISQADYTLAIHEISVLLNSNSSAGSANDLEVMRLGRIIEDYEITRSSIPTFEPFYCEA